MEHNLHHPLREGLNDEDALLLRYILKPPNVLASLFDDPITYWVATHLMNARSKINGIKI
jgi:hypothetical protein